MVNERYSIAIAETLHYLQGINQNDIKKIPHKFMEFLEKNASPNYKCKFDYTKPLKDLKLMDETRGLISMICLNYWCENDEQKDNFKKHLNENEIRYQEELRKKYNLDDIFNKKESLAKEEIAPEDILPMQSPKENILQKVWKRILKILHIK